MTLLLHTTIQEQFQNYAFDRVSKNFPETFQKRISRFHKKIDTQRSLLGRILLQQGMIIRGESFSHSEISESPYGKPFFINREIHFNISHSADIVACCISNVPVGLDIEKKRNITLKDFESVLTSKERNFINKSEDKLKSFYNIWTKKEAVIKAEGRGFSLDTNSFETESDQVYLEEEIYYLINPSIAKDYECCIALKNSLPELSPFKSFFHKWESFTIHCQLFNNF